MTRADVESGRRMMVVDEWLVISQQIFCMGINFVKYSPGLLQMLISCDV